jgi:transcription-repair coupling factor (superfamily II helicase)
MNDRFGKIPQEVDNLIYVSYLKNSCKKLGIEKLEIIKDGASISFRDNKFKDPDRLLKMIFDSKNAIKLLPDHKILFINKSSDMVDKDRIGVGFKVIEALEKFANPSM